MIEENGLSLHYWTDSPFSYITTAPISYYPRERKEWRSKHWKWGKGNHPKVNDTGVSDLWDVKLDHLQPVELILFQHISILLLFIQVQACAEKRDCWAKHQPGVAAAGQKLSLNLPPFLLLNLVGPIYIAPERGRKEQGLKMGEKESLKVNE